MRGARSRLQECAADGAEVRPRGERGIILIAVLMAVVIMSLSVMALSSVTRSGMASARLEQRLLASRFALRSGLELAKASIIAIPPEDRALLNGEPMLLKIGSGITAEISIRDAAGLADLNRSDMQLIEALLAQRLSADSAKSLANRIGDLRGGAKTPDPPRTTTADAPAVEAGPESNPVVFRSADQLPPLAEDSASVSRALTGLVTVFNPLGLINPLAAPPEVLAAVPGMKPEDIAAIAAARSTRNWKSNAALLAILDKHQTFLAAEAPSVFVIGIRLIDGQDVIAGRRASAVVLSSEDEALPFRTLFASGL